MVGIAGVNTRQLQKAAIGIAGIDSARLHGKAGLGVAGNLSSTLRPTLKQVTTASDAKFGNSTIGDRVARDSWARACYLLDASYLVCSDGQGGIRWRSWAQDMFLPNRRRLPLYLDSGAFRRWAGTAPKWFTYDAYMAAIRLTEPDGFMSFDVVGDQAQSLQNYQRILTEGPDKGCIPVWQVGPTWEADAGSALQFSGDVSAAARLAAGNARLAVRDPVMLHYAVANRLIAIGGLVQGPCPREVRHVYLAELCRLMPDHQFWGLGQASQAVVNGLGTQGLLDRVWLDGSWWIHHARTEQIAVVQDGLLKNLRLTFTGAESFFTFSERAASNIRSLLGAYDGKWVWPDPAPLPTDMNDMDAVLELKRRLKPAQMDLWSLLGPDFDTTGTEGDK